MPKPLPNQCVVVVGASSGIGRATALAFAGAGARVVVTARSAGDLEDLVERIREGGGEALPLVADVTRPEEVQQVACRAVAQYGGIDTWVNAAAVTVYGRVEEVSPEEYERVLRVNALGQVHGALAALPHLRAGGGVLIGIGSVESYRAVPLQAAYAMSKFAVRGFYDALRIELAEEGAPVAVSTILPVGIDTPLFEHARAHQRSLPKPPPPVYAPEVVASAIVRAAVRPTREVPVGAPALAFVLAQRLSPGLSDAVMAAGGLLARVQRSSLPDDPRDNLHAPMTGTGRAGGRYPGRVLRRSVLTRLVAHRIRPGDLALRAVTALQRRRTNRVRSR